MSIKKVFTGKPVTEKHLDPAQTNKPFISFLKATGKELGDTFTLYEANKWVQTRAQEYKRLNGHTELYPLQDVKGWPETFHDYCKTFEGAP